MEDLNEDDTYVQYDEDGELVFHQVSFKVFDMLGEAESITSDSDWTEQLRLRSQRNQIGFSRIGFQGIQRNVISEGGN